MEAGELKTEQDITDSKAPVGGPLANHEPWDLVADAYAADLMPWAEHFAAEALELAALPASSNIVDVAAGPAPALLAAREGATASAIDFSPAMIANLRRRAVEAGLSDMADVRVGDGPGDEVYTQHLGVAIK